MPEVSIPRMVEIPQVLIHELDGHLTIGAPQNIINACVGVWEASRGSAFFATTEWRNQTGGVGHLTNDEDLGPDNRL